MGIIIYTNATAGAILCLALGWVAVSNRINEGPVINIGLGMTATGLLCMSLVSLSIDQGPGATERPVIYLINALALLQIGVIAVIVGIWLRMRRSPAARDAFSAITGWPAIDDTTPKPLTTNGDRHG